jgi:prepilin-type processing-associated H-X9-DG protein
MLFEGREPLRVNILDHDQAARVLVCPADARDRAAWWVYPFTYTLNFKLLADYEHGEPLRLSQVRNPAETIMVVEEAARTLGDENWAPSEWYSPERDILSVAHDRGAEMLERKDAGRGNVLFCDGHQEFFPRALTFEKQYFDPLYVPRPLPAK